MAHKRIPNGHPVDVHVGARLRLRRILLGLSQEKLGEALGLSFQQVQKYERGSNRVSASRLWQIAKVLEVPVSFFFDDMPDEDGRIAAVNIAPFKPEMFTIVEGRLLRDFRSLPGPTQDAVREVVRRAAHAGDGEPAELAGAA